MVNGTKPGMMKYCVVGNIVMERLDENGVTRHEIPVFPGGRKVYISRRLWKDGVTVLGLNRYKNNYVLEKIPLAWIDNIRFSKTFQPKLVELMANTDESRDMWWLYKEEDKNGAMEYAQLLNRIKNGDQEAFDQYYRDVMWRFF